MNLFLIYVPHQWIAQWQVDPMSVYCDGVGVMSCVCSMAFLCGSTFDKVPLLQAGTIAIRSQMFKSDVNPQQTNKFNIHVLIKYEQIPPPPPRPDFDASREKLQRLGEGEGTMTKEEFTKMKQELEA